MRAPRWLRGPVALVVCLLGPVPAATAQDGGSLSCRASALRVEFPAAGPLPTLEPFTANARTRPCGDDWFALLPETRIGPVAVTLVDGATAARRDGADARSRIARVRLGEGPLTITADVLEASAEVACRDGHPVLTGSSRVVGLTVLGQTVALPAEDRPFLVPVPGAGVLVLNQEERTETTITRRALVLQPSDPAVPRVVVSEATAGHAGAPCPTARARLQGACVDRRSFRAQVTGRNIRAVRFSLDGRRVATDTSAPFAARVRTGREGRRHRLRARVRFDPVTAAAPRTLRLRFRGCRPAPPRYTG